RPPATAPPPWSGIGTSRGPRRACTAGASTWADARRSPGRGSAASAGEVACLEEVGEGGLVDHGDAELLGLRQLGRAGAVAGHDGGRLLRHASRRPAPPARAGL